MAKHPNKHIREAIRHAEKKGWTCTKAGPRAHIWGTLWCPEQSREGYRIHVMSTPRNPRSMLAIFAVMSIAAPMDRLKISDEAKT